MNWWGKIIGGTFGFAMGGPLGAVLGAALGNYFDKGMQGVATDDLLGNQGAERVQAAFFTAVFTFMGYIAKADGRVSKDEIALTEQVMNQMQLDPTQRKLAISLFDQGKQASFPYAEALEQFRRECQRRRNLIQMFLEIITATALSDGQMDPKERSILQSIATGLGVPKAQFDMLVMRMSAQFRFQTDSNPRDRLADAYKVLGVDSKATTDEVKRAYRRLMSQHHPDKLVSKGLPEEMMEIATRKTQEIKTAYEVVMESRGTQ